MTTSAALILDRAAAGAPLSDAQALALAGCDDLNALLAAARSRRDLAHPAIVSYSPKVFIPLTRLCRDVCRYCTFAAAPRALKAPFLSIDEAIRIAETGAGAGCHEALFTLGDQPERRYRIARRVLAALGHDTTIGYLAEVALRVRTASGLLPHVNPGVMCGADLLRLREVSVSAGLMLESASERLCAPGGAHHGCPDKRPEVRLATIRAAGELAIPFTSGILIGIGETRRERIEALLALRGLHAEHGHLQEIIVQNFRAKPGTAMARAPEPSLDDHLWTIAVARLVLPPEISLQAPPNLNPDALDRLLAAGINDWGGISPVTPDHVNPEAPWPELELLRRATEAAGKELVARLAIYPRYVQEPERWLAAVMRAPVLGRADAEGYAREAPWIAGSPSPVTIARARCSSGSELQAIFCRARNGRSLGEREVLRLFAARGREVDAVCREADELRREANGEPISYVVNRNINYTNICYFRCRFCAFSKGRLARNLRGPAYDLELDEIARRTREAWARGATEVCLQGGIHPDYSGATYLEICRTVKAAAPEIHVHAFSPLEIWQGARTLRVPVGEFLGELRRAGLGSLPGTAAEILDDEVRRVICPDKITTSQWLEVMRSAHALGLRSTATIMFGHVDHPRHWARHLLRIRELQADTGGVTEFVPLPFVHMEAPIYLQGAARRGPTWREALLMHAVARLALHPHITNIQTSWVKMGPRGAQACLNAGANDLGGTLMNESITRAAGAAFGQELPPHAMQALIRELGRVPCQRTTVYGKAPRERIEASVRAEPLTEPVNRPPRRQRRSNERPLVRFG
ncbi:MAG TPA: 5-amino-6-(D-ribitylamino)uracil--L-tyrosine 4-hydroxyphenyl transferase CofH [Geminicoccaceae bacterium]|nr:5-amino-6-(D-ribitylamino)uracil--L-tyrosine 4-hydroxyphenyl transferase CofH [Geminicoccaceae bacterium]